MSEHTPGPWIAMMDCRGGGISHAIFEKHECVIQRCLDENCDKYIVRDTPSAELAIVHFNSWEGDLVEDTGATGRANARLMAAAPEIIEALKGMLSVAITGRNFTGEVGQALIKQASAAIAKAEEGEEYARVLEAQKCAGQEETL